MRAFMRPAAAGILTLALFAACKRDRDQYASGSIDTLRPARITDSATAMAPAVMADRWASPNVLGFVVVANRGEVALGKLAQRKATHADVKAFANLMVTDHSAMLRQIEKIGSAMSVVADTTTDAARDQSSDDHDEMIDMTEEPAGTAWDREYMDEMIESHKETLEKLRNAAKYTPDAQLKTALDDAIGKIQSHLTTAETIRAKLN